ncbi:MAG: hypothetical protein Q4C09_09005 [Atopobiaceae bacterium]|nr:hypothetical protein [Atopobiaceae bacterium]
MLYHASGAYIYPMSTAKLQRRHATGLAGLLALEGLPLIASEQALQTDELSAWFGGSLPGVTLAATYTLSYNGAVLARRGVGYMLGLENIAPTGVGSGLEFRPLWPPIVAHIDFAWRRDAKLSNAAALYLEEMREACLAEGGT